MFNRMFTKVSFLFAVTSMVSVAYAGHFYVMNGLNQRVDFPQATTITVMVCTGNNLTGSASYPHTLTLLTDGRAREATYSNFSFYQGQTPVSVDVQSVLDTDMTAWSVQNGISAVVIENASGQSYARDPNSTATCGNGGTSGCCASCQFPQLITVGGTL